MLTWADASTMTPAALRAARCCVGGCSDRELVCWRSRPFPRHCAEGAKREAEWREAMGAAGQCGEEVSIVRACEWWEG